MSDTFQVRPIGRVTSERCEPIDDGWDAIPTAIELDPQQFTAEALMGLDGFSHAEIVFLFDRVKESEIEKSARHPRGRKDWPKIGIFAQRGKNRPNRIGCTVCKVVAVDGLRLVVRGLDAIDGTPVLDIKPVMSGFQPRGTLTEPQWAKEIMAAYW
jgi:tRNA (Thr-GGU) A37 N-methylase